MPTALAAKADAMTSDVITSSPTLSSTVPTALKSLREDDVDPICNRTTGGPSFATDNCGWLEFNGDSDREEYDDIGEGSSPASSLSSLPFADSDAESGSEAQVGTAPGLIFAGEEGWRMGHRIEGCLGTVHWALDEVVGGFLSVRVLEGRGRNGAPTRGRVLQEIQRWKQIRHPSILAVMGFACVGDNIYVHQEVSSLGPLSSFLKEFGPLTGVFLRRTVGDLTSALSHLHNLKHPMAHGNIRAATLLMDDDRLLLSADFADAELLEGRALGAGTSIREALPWTAPEVVRRSVGDNIIQSKDRHLDHRKADIWSLACTVIEMATAAVPWGSDMPRQVLTATLQGSVPEKPQLPLEHLSAAGVDFCRACLTWDEDLRPEASEILRHPFIDEFTN